MTITPEEVTYTDAELSVVVLLKIPFYGKRQQALKFIENELKRILDTGVSSDIEVLDTVIEPRRLNNLWSIQNPLLRQPDEGE